MITLNLKWFVGLSVAAHAAVLVGWQSPALSPGSSSHAVHLTVAQQTDSRQTTENIPSDEPGESTRSATPVHGAARKADTGTLSKSPQPAPTSQTLFAAAKPVPETPATTSAPPVTTASSPTIPRHEADRHLRDSVMRLVTQELTYPAIARRKGWQGIVKLELHIEADGSITGLQLDETSGYAILDKAALQCLQTASIPNATQWLQGRSIDIIVPVEYRLIGG